MKIETKLTFNNIRKNFKRTIYTTISIILCSFLIIATILIATSIGTGIKENIASEYNDYHFIIKNLDLASFNKIKDKEYIEQFYLQENDEGQLYKLEELPDSFNMENGMNVYIKYDNFKKTASYTNDIFRTLNYSVLDTKEKCEFNTKLLTTYGLIDVSIGIRNATQTDPICQVRLNFAYVLDILFILILLVFSILSIIILYNAFLITINERKKEYAILNSIGATEGQILKITFLENIIIGIVGIIIGGLLSVLGANIILKLLNNILEPTVYNFNLVIDIKYIVLALLIIIVNIYVSSVIPSAKASNTSVIQGIKSNKQIKYKKRNSIFTRILPIEGKLASKNLKRNKNKYRIITILLVICMISYITVSTYINYEKEVAELVNEYDVDAEVLTMNQIDYYKEIFGNYATISGNKIEYFEYKRIGPNIRIEPKEALQDNIDVDSGAIKIIGLDDQTYNNTINKLNGKYGDYIIYNNIAIREGEEEFVYKYYKPFKTNYKLNFTIIDIVENKEGAIIDDEILGDNYIFTNEPIEGFKDRKNYPIITIFSNMDLLNNIVEKVKNYSLQNNLETLPVSSHYAYKTSQGQVDGMVGTYLKIKCEDIIDFANYIEKIEEEQNIHLGINFYSLENEEKIIYTNVLQLILRTIIITIILIGITSSINIINASLCERKEEFETLSRIGATTGNINKTLIYECIYMFIKAMLISIVLSIPILYIIIKSMEKVIILDEILIPFGSIGLFILILFVISIIITLYSTRFIQEE